LKLFDKLFLILREV